MSWLRKWWWIPTLVVVLAAGAAALLVVAFPAGADSAAQALFDEIEEDAEPDSARVLIEEPWGDGQLVLARYRADGEDRLGLGFAIEGRRGWRVSAFTQEAASLDDVAVGSLLVASSEGGAGQPPWTAVVGELGDSRIHTVEITWDDDEATSTERERDAYLLVREGAPGPVTATFLTEDGVEIAVVPIDV